MQLDPDAIAGVKEKDKRIVKVGNRVKDPTVTFLARMVEVGGLFACRAAPGSARKMFTQKASLGAFSKCHPKSRPIF